MAKIICTGVIILTWFAPAVVYQDPEPITDIHTTLSRYESYGIMAMPHISEVNHDTEENVLPKDTLRVSPVIGR